MNAYAIASKDLSNKGIGEKGKHNVDLKVWVPRALARQF